MKKTMFITAGISMAATALAIALHQFFGWEIASALAITAGTIFYHLAMRLAVGGLVSGLRIPFDHRRWWFCERGFEPKLYRFLKVRHWKHRMPTYSPGSFDVNACTPEEIIRATCEAEVVHEIIIPLSFLPLLAIIEHGVPAVFIVTSVLAALFDSLFILLQRFNRPRLVKLWERQRIRSL